MQIGAHISPLYFVLMAHNRRKQTLSWWLVFCSAGIGAPKCVGAGRLSRRPPPGRRHRRGRLPRHPQEKTKGQAQEKCWGKSNSQFNSIQFYFLSIRQNIYRSLESVKNFNINKFKKF